MYTLENGIKPHEIIFPITERAVQKQLKLVSDYLELDGVGTHSFRKFYATRIYNENGHNIALVQQLLQHSSPVVTQKYIGIQSKQLEEAIEKHICLI
jgi:site-specific recombinase XerD